MTTPKRTTLGHALVAVALVAVAGASALPAVGPATGDTTTTSVATGTTTTTSTVPSTTTTTTIPRSQVLPWPQQGSAAVAVPQLSVAAASPRQPRVPIASLTKMMTAWVILHRLPLTYSQQGPCKIVSKHDAEVYEHDLATGQSSAKVAEGTTICEGTLLRGLLVHSAGNYAAMLVEMTHLSTPAFVRLMNADALALGLTHTHYVDITGIDPRDRSTALDQAYLAADLMGAESIVRAIVALPHVRLPAAGVVISYTPLVGQDGVVGVKSGYTDPAGGCDAMAVRVRIGSIVVTTYAVVLGQHSSNALGLAGQTALALSRALRRAITLDPASGDTVLAWVGWPGYVVPTTTTTTTTTSTTSTTSTTTTTLP